MKKKSGSVVGAIICLALLVLMIFPGWMPFGAETKEAVREAVRSTFNIASAADGTSGIAIPTIAALICMVALVLLIKFVINAALNSMKKRGKRSQTIASLLEGLLKYVTAIVIVVWGLAILGVNVAGIFAGLGILGIVIGFGAQSLVEDIITGIFIIFEGQYNVGDIIVLDDFRGVVRSIGVRTTAFEDTGGNLKIINNSDIRNMQQRSRNRSIATCDCGVHYRYTVAEIKAIFERELPKYYEANKSVFLGPPRLLGLQSLDDSGVVWRTAVDVEEENIFVGTRLLNACVKDLLDRNNIEIPFPQITLTKGDNF